MSRLIVKWTVLVSSVLTLLVLQTNAQTNVKDSLINAPLIGASITYQQPSGNLDERFGSNASVGASFLYKTKKNWMFGIDWNYLFGNKIKEPGLLQNLFTADGTITNQNGEPAILKVFERGWYSHAQVGRLFSVLAPNKNSGFFITVGGGVLMHKIRIENSGNNTPQLSKAFLKGYDRLTAGLSTSQFIGYLYLDNRRLINVFAGIELIQGYTHSLRGYNYDTAQYDTEKRKDFLTGFKVGIMIPLYKRLPSNYYYY